uniref:PDZ domain-containing protein n=1 Tax=Peronospora matthiolae TaxID=2874970 RepID=A0AAV1TSB3_9STRA
MELARSLPALVEELRALRNDMTRKSELYDSLLRTSSSSSSSSSSTSSDPLRRSTTSDGLNSSSNHDHDHLFPPSIPTPFLHRPARGTSALKHHSHSHSSWSSSSKHLDSYTVIYVSGDCGIALRNYAKRDTKVGAQIAMLHHADGVTTGMSKCRLGDQLMKINNESVTTWPFAEIVETLEIARRPISLTFRTNASVQTSPRASTATSSSFAPSSSSSSSSMRFSASLPLRKSKSHSEAEDAAAVARKAPTSSFFSRSRVLKASTKEKNEQRMRDGGVMDDKRQSCSQIDRLKDAEDDDGMSRQRSASHDTLQSVGGGTTTTSMLSEDVETWCREQEEMHSDIIMLLTETVMRCERLQQENLDQLQNLMQLSVSSSCSLSDRSSAASSYAGAEKSGSGGDKYLEFLDGYAAGPVAATSPTSSSPRA